MAKKKKDINNSPDIDLDLDFNPKQWEALSTEGNEILYGGLLRATFHSNVSK